MTIGMNEKKAGKGENKYSGKTEGPMGGCSSAGSRMGKSFTKKEAYPKGSADTGYMTWKG